MKKLPSAILGMCLLFFMGQSLAQIYADERMNESIRKVQNSVLKKYSSYTMGEALSKLKCEKQSWYFSPKSILFDCISPEDTESLNEYDKGENKVRYVVSFYTTNGQISDIGANVLILHSGQLRWSINLRQQFELGRDEFLTIALNPSEEGSLFPLDNFIKSRSKGRYTNLIDFVEQMKKTRVLLR